MKDGKRTERLMEKSLRLNAECNEEKFKAAVPLMTSRCCYMQIVTAFEVTKYLVFWP